MRSPRGLVLLTVFIALVGAVLYTHPGDGEVYIGVSSDVGPLPTVIILTTRRLIGVVLIWVASLMAAGLIGWLVTRNRSEQPQV